MPLCCVDISPLWSSRDSRIYISGAFYVSDVVFVLVEYATRSKPAGEISMKIGRTRLDLETGDRISQRHLIGCLACCAT